jgi:bifunctional non-homologous end joining protein LigD
MAREAGRTLPLAGIPGPQSGDRIMRVSDREIKLTNLDKIFWPDESYTKFDLLDYYHRVSGFIVPHLLGRPLTLKRYPNGFRGDHFFQKEAPPEIPDWVHTELIAAESTSEVTGPARRRGKRAKIRYVICEDEASLLYIANLGCISQNPWLSVLPDVETPDIMAFDIDPADEDDFDACVETALLVRDRLAAFGLRGYPKTSGASGIHIFVPVLPRYTFDQVRQFAEMLSILCRDAAPELITLEQPLARRTGARIYLDFRQNVKGKTLASAYSVRARPGAPVSAPLEWSEIRIGLRPSDFNIRNMPERLAEVGDLFGGVLTDRQDLLAALEEGRRFLKTG